LHTPLESLGVEELLRADCVLLMSVPAGFSGQVFDANVLSKIQELRQRGFEQDIVIDGGLNLEMIKRCQEAGANQFAVTSFLWQAEDVVERWRELNELIG
jgi:ribulose-phosphate 3-epimerase